MATKKLTAAQQAAQDELLAEMSAPVKEDASPIPEATFAVVMGLGDTIIIGGRKLNVAPFRFMDLPAASLLINQLPTELLAYAYVAHTNGSFDADTAAAVYNEAAHRAWEAMPDGEGKPDAPKPIDGAYVDRYVRSMGSSLNAIQASAMMDIVRLAVSRHAPDVTSEWLNDHLNIPLFLTALTGILAANPSFLDRV